MQWDTGLWTPEKQREFAEECETIRKAYKPSPLPTERPMMFSAEKIAIQSKRYPDMVVEDVYPAAGVVDAPEWAGWYKSTGRIGECLFYDKSMWEVIPPVPPQPTWRDVTAECEVQCDNQIYHKDVKPDGSPYWRHVTDEGGNDSYRLTKISGPLKQHVAFIVEKRA